ncbi:hypothetical protein [Flavobacterium sp.]|uniref:hypothetical protein n=1 Tax=Flavobacterium sp. TaxID=239 RepID=UPI004047DFA5
MKRKTFIPLLIFSLFLFNCKENTDTIVDKNSTTTSKENDIRNNESNSSQITNTENQTYFTGTWSSLDYYPIINLEIETDSTFKIKEAYGLDAEKGTEYKAVYKKGIVEAMGNEKDFYKLTLPTFEFIGQNTDTLSYKSGIGLVKLIKTNVMMPKISYNPPKNND